MAETLEISGMVWTRTETARGRTYTNTTDNITGVAYIESMEVFSTVVMVDGEKEPRWVFDNRDYSEWNRSGIWSVLSVLGENMYSVEQDLMEESEDDFYAVGADYDAYDAYDTEYDRY